MNIGYRMKLQRRRLRCILAYAHVFLEIKNYTLNTKQFFIIYWFSYVYHVLRWKLKGENAVSYMCHVSIYNLQIAVFVPFLLSIDLMYLTIFCFLLDKALVLEKKNIYCIV